MNNTVVRTLSGLVYGALIFLCLLVNGYLFAALIIFMMCVMMAEFYKMTMGESYKKLQGTAIFAGIFIFLLANTYIFGSGKPWLIGFGILMVLMIMILSLFEKDHTDFQKTGFLYAGLLYIAIPIALSNFVVCKDGAFSGLLMVAFFCIIWASDVGAYCFGMLLGRKVWTKKMCPSISPKKSWAGFWGGMLMAVLAGAILYWTGLFTFPIWHCLIVAALMHVAGVFGDLFESLWKRSAGVKDSGNLIPGHGGLLDRFDSALFAIPVGVIYLLLVRML